MITLVTLLILLGLNLVLNVYLLYELKKNFAITERSLIGVMQLIDYVIELIPKK